MTVIIKSINEVGGKMFHLQLLKNGGFEIPATYSSEDNLMNLPDELTYVVRSSSPNEDSDSKTSAGIYKSILGVEKKDLSIAVNEVLREYNGGVAVIQEDLTDKMVLSGVAYSNLNGKIVVSLGKQNAVQSIVEGGDPDTEIVFSNGNYTMNGKMQNPDDIERIKEYVLDVENYFGRPMDIEFAVLSDKIVSLQARPLPNITDAGLKEHENRKLMNVTDVIRSKGLEELVLGVGNYREILGDKKATNLSVSIFNYIFAGNGKNLLGAVQLGRNELGYDIGYEIFPWVIMLGDKVYYNFGGDALQFRPKGLDIDNLMKIINKVYIPMSKSDTDILNYPELRMYIQFPEDAINAGLSSQPYEELVNNIRKEIELVEIPKEIPIKRKVDEFSNIADCVKEIKNVMDEIRIGSAKEYVKAARIAFFALEDIRFGYRTLKETNSKMYKDLVQKFGFEDPEKLRDAVVYDESIKSFETPLTDEYKYLGSFELTLPRGFAPKRHFKEGRKISDHKMQNELTKVRRILEYREKVKFELFRDYEYLRELVFQIQKNSNLKEDIYYLDESELDLLNNNEIFSEYRINIRKNMRGKELHPDPVFESNLYNGNVNYHEKEPELVFGTLPNETLNLKMGEECYVVKSVDQTLEIPEEIKLVLVPENIRPGSHLFTILSDYDVPVIGVPIKQLETFKKDYLQIKKVDENVELNCY